MSDWLTDEELNEVAQTNQLSGRPTLVLAAALIAQAREANRLRKGIEEALRDCNEDEFPKALTDILEPKP